MEDNRQKPGFFVRLATLIVDKRNLFFLLYTAGIIFSLISQGWVQVNNDITDYLPEETETRHGLGFAVLSVALGKMVGSLIYFSQQIFLTGG